MALRRASVAGISPFSTSPYCTTIRSRFLGCAAPLVANGTTLMGPGPTTTFPFAGPVSRVLRDYISAADPDHVGAGGPLSDNDRRYLTGLNVSSAGWKNFADLKESRSAIKELPDDEARRVLSDGTVGTFLAKGVSERKVRSLIKLDRIAQQAVSELNGIDASMVLDKDTPEANRLLALPSQLRTKLLRDTSARQMKALLDDLAAEPESQTERFVDAAAVRRWMFDLDQPDKKAVLRLFEEHPRLAERMTKQGFHGLKIQDQTVLGELESLPPDQYHQYELEFVRSGRFKAPTPRANDVYNQGTLVGAANDVGLSLRPGIGRALFRAVWSGKTVRQTLRDASVEDVKNVAWTVLTGDKPSEIRELWETTFEAVGAPKKDQVAIYREGVFRIFVLKPLLVFLCNGAERFLPVFSNWLLSALDAYLKEILTEDGYRDEEGTPIDTTNTDS